MRCWKQRGLVCIAGIDMYKCFDTYPARPSRNLPYFVSDPSRVAREAALKIIGEFPLNATSTMCKGRHHLAFPDMGKRSFFNCRNCRLVIKLALGGYKPSNRGMTMVASKQGRCYLKIRRLFAAKKAWKIDIHRVIKLDWKLQASAASKLKDYMRAWSP